ncbi:sensor histidine kinase [Pseudotabrizicola sediminis]|uniref:histidine kinase n=1 Tax=Pseudotabrizicola sediminis TaxID=2486418 RepID=A0ABY2KRF9_9RHOB|nr:sensor histidine kinase [Pseudotabrizicola sediminis]TGD45371.1 sensor histidine kinase [Pseudotabrizicola sediminis]
MPGRDSGREKVLRAPSLRRRLVVQLLVLAAVLALVLSLAVQVGAGRASQATLDAVLGAAAQGMAEEMRAEEGGVVIDMQPATLSMLAAMGEERIFYRVDIGGLTVTGYGDLPLPGRLPTALTPVFYTVPFREAQIRVAAVARSLRVDGRAAPALVLLGQTREGQEAIAARLGLQAAALGLAVFLAAIPLALLVARSLTRPIDLLAEAVGRRGPRDLRPVRHPAPRELQPFVTALNSFIGRLRGTLSQTETFIAEAAHHIRTPLAVMRNEAELALRQSSEEDTRARLRGLIRSADDAARSAGQLLDHATVLYRADQADWAKLDLAAMTRAVAARLAPAAGMKDMDLVLTIPAVLTCEGDAVLIEAALRNILDNAIKYSPPDSVVEVSALAEGPMAVVTVADRGRGLGGTEPDRLLRRFRRGDNVGDVMGSGLGLTIVEEAAGAMGGTFRLRARQGGGACAEFCLPLA